MAKYIYPAVFTMELNGQYSVRFPDLESCYTQGEDLTSAYEMAEDVLCLCLYNLERANKQTPESTYIENVVLAPSEFVSLVSADTMEYRRFFDNKAVKKTLTIPSWLNDMAERQDVNFSNVLQVALKERLHITD